MNVFADFQARIAALMERRVAAGELPAGLDLGRFVVEPPRDPSHGDLSTNAAMVYAKEAKAAGSSLRSLADSLARDLAQDADVAKAQVAGPGFLNIVLNPDVYQRILRSVVTLGPRFGSPSSENGEKVNVEYVSANPTGPMHRNNKTAMSGKYSLRLSLV